MISIEEEHEVESPRTPFHFGTGLYLYPYTPHFTAPFDLDYFQTPIDSLGNLFGHSTMVESTSQTVPSITATAKTSVITSSMFTTTFGHTCMVFCPSHRVTNINQEPTEVLLLIIGLHQCPLLEFYLVPHLRVLNSWTHQVHIKLAHLVTILYIRLTLDYPHMEKNMHILLILHILGGNHMSVCCHL